MKALVLPLRRSGRVELPRYLPARMLNEFGYCPRLFFYEWVEGVFAHSADTIEGSLRQEKLGERKDSLPLPEPREQIRSRAVTLASDTLGLIAAIDLVEGDGQVSPVDYKKGRPREGGEGAEAWPADRVQLCAQALILRDNGYCCNEAVIYYDATRQRLRVAIDDALVTETTTAIESARRLAARAEIPPPLVDSPKCPGCSLVGICLPDATVLCGSAGTDQLGPQLPLFSEYLRERAAHGRRNPRPLLGGEADRPLLVRRLVLRAHARSRAKERLPATGAVREGERSRVLS